MDTKFERKNNMKNYSFLLETESIVNQRCENSGEERCSQEMLKIVSNDFSDVLKRDRILNCDAFNVLNHAEALLGYDALCQLANENSDGKVSGKLLLMLLNGYSMEEIKQWDIDCAWETKEIHRMLDAIKDSRIAEASELLKEQRKECETAFDELGEHHFCDWARQTYRINLTAWALDQALPTCKSDNPRREGWIKCFMMMAKYHTLYNPQFINLEKEAAISSMSYSELNNKKIALTEEASKAKDPTFIIYEDEFYDDAFSFWFRPIENKENQIIVVSGITSTYDEF